MTTVLSKVDKGVLLTIPNPRYEELVRKYSHLNEVVMNDNDKKSNLPIHVILGASDYSKIKTATKPKIGQPLEPIAERTTLGWTMMSSGCEPNLAQTYLTRTSGADYQELCNLDVLGLEDRPDGDQHVVYEEFAEQLTRNKDGRYETSLLCRAGHSSLPTNESGSLKRLDSLVKKLGRDPELLEKYDKIIQEQLAEGIVERVVETPKDREFYIPHKPVIKETAKTTKVRIVFDASAKENEQSPSLNDCLETGPALQNLLWNVLVRNRLKPIALSAHLKQAFLQVVIRPHNRDVLRFHWIKNKDPSNIEVLRFTRALFGLVQSPFLLAGTLKQHLNSLRERYPAEVAKIEKCLYVDDIISGGCTTDEVSSLKETTVSMFEAAKFQLHKWHSNESKLESSEEDGDLQGSNHPSYAKQQLGVRSDETKLLGLPWNKSNDTLAVGFPTKPTETTRREILRFDEIELHSFGDASGSGVSAADYAVVKQHSGASVGLIIAKSRLAKKNLTIPRLELVSAHVAANLADNVRIALDGYPVKAVYGWLDSLVALYWIRGTRTYRQFVPNRVSKINAKELIVWRHIGTDLNPVDRGSRGCETNRLTGEWLNGFQTLTSGQRL